MITALSQASPELHHVMVDMINGCASGAPAAEIVIAPCCRNNLTKALCDYRCFGQRRGTALSNAPPIGSGQHLDLEVKLLKPIYQPRALAITYSHEQGFFPQDASASLKGTLWAATRCSSSSISCSFSFSRATLLCRCFSGLPAHALLPTSSGVLLLLLRGVGVCALRLSCLRACGASLCECGVPPGWRSSTSLASDAAWGGKEPDGELLWSHIRASLMHEVDPFTGRYTGRCATVRPEPPRPSKCLVCFSCGSASSLSLLGFW